MFEKAYVNIHIWEVQYLPFSLFGICGIFSSFQVFVNQFVVVYPEKLANQQKKKFEFKNKHFSPLEC